MRTLIFGGTGMLGQAVTALGRRRGHGVLALGRSQADICQPASLRYWADAFRPQLIVNCAAFTQVDDCETRRDHAMEVNGRAVAHVASAAESCGADLVHVSSDYVFVGDATSPYSTDAPVGPRSVYGESKLLGETEALAYERSIVLRTSWLFGPGGPNFVATIARLLRKGQAAGASQAPLRVVDDQVGGPTYTPFLARAILDLAGQRAYGIQHYQNREAVSWHGFAVEIARTLNIRTEVVPVPTSEFPRPAQRPSYSVLDVANFEDIVGRGVEPWSAGLTAYLSGDQP